MLNVWLGLLRIDSDLIGLKTAPTKWSRLIKHRAAHKPIYARNCTRETRKKTFWEHRISSHEFTRVARQGLGADLISPRKMRK